MSHIQSHVTELPNSCKSAAEHTAQVLQAEDRYANLTDHCCQKITELEQELSRSTGENVVLVAYQR